LLQFHLFEEGFGSHHQKEVISVPWKHVNTNLIEPLLVISANAWAGWLRAKQGLSVVPDAHAPLVGIMVDEGPILPILMLGEIHHCYRDE
jgi:hypothetical protein